MKTALTVLIWIGAGIGAIFIIWFLIFTIAFIKMILEEFF